MPMNSLHQIVHCKCLQGFMGCLRVFPRVYREKGCKKHRETLYSLKGNIVCVLGKPCNIYRLRGKPYDNYRIYPLSVNITRFPPQHTQSFPLMSKGFLCDSYSPFHRYCRENLWTSRKSL